MWKPWNWSKLTRRQWLRRLAVSSVAAATGVLAYTHWIEPHWVEIVHRDLPILGLGPDLVGTRLIQLSDIHVGPRVSSEYVIQAFDTVSQLKPDFLVLTGDLISSRNDGSAPLEEARRVYSHLTPARLGTVCILGNHDYGWGWSNLQLADSVAQIMKEVGCEPLRNDVVTVGGLRIVGLDDLWSQQFGHRLMSNLAASPDPTLVLCHNPDAADLPVWSTYQGWMLSGHTHGGQCKPPFLRPPLLPVKNKRYTSGSFDLYDGRWLYINRGLGHLAQVRFNVRPEITVFHLRRAIGTITA